MGGGQWGGARPHITPVPSLPPPPSPKSNGILAAPRPPPAQPPAVDYQQVKEGGFGGGSLWGAVYLRGGCFGVRLLGGRMEGCVLG